VYASVSANDVPEAEVFKQLESLSNRYPDDPLFKMGGARISLDGPVESQDAALLQPYESRADYQGPERIDPDVLNRLVRLLDAQQRQVTISGDGDRAVRMALNAFEHAVRSNPEPERRRRHRIEGIALVDAADVARFGRLGTIATMRPDDMMLTSDRFELWAKGVGPERASRAWPAASLVSARAQLAFAMSSPAGINPFAAIQTAVTRSMPEGLPEDGWPAAERVSLKRAINALTSVSAYASFDEQRKGSLKKGMLADLVVLSDDIFDLPATELSRTTVAATIFDGKIVYQRSAKTTN
jgi:predicted amidohydrolase YtcJ